MSELSEKRPVELRAIARDLGVEGWDRMTGPIALSAILAYEDEHQEGDYMQSRFVVYQGEDGLWYWHHKADNGATIADSGEGYDSKWNAERARDRAVELAAEEWAREDAAKR